MQNGKLPYDVARIRARCARAGITPLDLSRAVGVHHSTINRWLHGATSPTVRTLQRFDQYLDSLRVPRSPQINEGHFVPVRRERA